jgi:glycosyltransferase involved in cell wall biosynthesis
MHKDISIVLPVKNGEAYIKSCLLNLSQIIESNDEILVIDDSSTDQTKNLVREEIIRDSRIRYLENSDTGIVAALNFGIHESVNGWVARADVDDRYEPDRLSEQRKIIKDDTVGIFTDYDFFSESQNYLGTIPSAIDANAVVVSLVSSQRTAHPSVLFNKEAVISAGGYKKRDFPAEDLSLWLRMSRLGNLISIPKTLLHYRLSKDSITGTRRNEAKKMTKKLLAEIGINPKNILGTIEKFEAVIELYQLYPHKNARELLLLKDLLYLSKNNLVDDKIYKKLDCLLMKQLPKHVLNIPDIQAIKLLHKERYLRNKVRKNQS